MKPIQKKEFKSKICPLSRETKYEMATLLMPNALIKLNDMSVDARIHKEILRVKTKMATRSSGRLSWQDIYKLYIVSEFDSNEINHWVMRGNEIYRLKSVKWIVSPISTRTRKPSIYDPNGNLVPRSFITKHLPNWIKTQKDYDHYMTTRRGK